MLAVRHETAWRVRFYDLVVVAGAVNRDVMRSSPVALWSLVPRLTAATATAGWNVVLATASGVIRSWIWSVHMCSFSDHSRLPDLPLHLLPLLSPPMFSLLQDLQAFFAQAFLSPAQRSIAVRRNASPPARDRLPARTCLVVLLPRLDDVIVASAVDVTGV